MLPGSVRRRSPSLFLSLSASLAARYTVRVAPFAVRRIAGSLQYGAPPSERGGARTETDGNYGGGKGRRPCGASTLTRLVRWQGISRRQNQPLCATTGLPRRTDRPRGGLLLVLRVERSPRVSLRGYPTGLGGRTGGGDRPHARRRSWHMHREGGAGRRTARHGWLSEQGPEGGRREPPGCSRATDSCCTDDPVADRIRSARGRTRGPCGFVGPFPEDHERLPTRSRRTRIARDSVRGVQREDATRSPGRAIARWGHALPEHRIVTTSPPVSKWRRPCCPIGSTRHATDRATAWNDRGSGDETLAASLSLAAHQGPHPGRNEQCARCAPTHALLTATTDTPVPAPQMPPPLHSDHSRWSVEQSNRSSARSAQRAPALIVLLVGATACERDFLAPTIAIQVMIDELSAVIRVEAKDGHRQQRAGVGDCRADCLLAPIGERKAFRPLGGDVGEHEAVQILAARAFPAMRDQIDFEETGAVVVPVGEGADGGCPRILVMTVRGGW